MLKIGLTSLPPPAEKDQATGLNKPPFKPCQPDTGTIKATDIKSKGVPLLDESSVMHKPTKLQNNDFDTAGSSLQGSHGGLKFDHKYLDDGRFCFTNVETPEGEKPGKLSEPEKLAIPDFKHSCDRVSEVDESEGTSTDRGKWKSLRFLRQSTDMLNCRGCLRVRPRKEPCGKKYT